MELPTIKHKNQIIVFQLVRWVELKILIPCGALILRYNEFFIGPFLLYESVATKKVIYKICLTSKFKAQP